jgi:hypothetical protein
MRVLSARKQNQEPFAGSAACRRNGNKYQILVAKRKDGDGSNAISGKHVAVLEPERPQ